MEKQKAVNGFRVGTNQWIPDDCFARLLDLMKKYPGAADELIFFTNETHPPRRIEDIRAFCELLKKRQEEARAAGFSAGVNILATIGHHEENLENSLDIPAVRATDPEGRISRGSYCLNDTAFQDYVTELYTQIAGTGPEFIYIDDDVRLRGHMPIDLTCFCGRCIGLFERETAMFSENGMEPSRENIIKLFNSPDITLRQKAREAWLAHNRDSIARLFSHIESVVHSINPDIVLGFMTGERYYEGFDFDNWAHKLKGPALEVRWRPGGGFYNDEKPGDAFEKANQIGRQCAFLPDYVKIIQSEIENFPYHMLCKSVRVTMYEAALHMAAGCTGAAYNVLPMDGEPISEHEAFFAAAAEKRPFFDAIASTFFRSEPVGIGPMWDKNSAACVHTSEDWPKKMNVRSNESLWQIGLPAAYHEDNCLVYTLSGGKAADFSEEQLKKILARGVYMDAETLDALNSLGYGRYTGFQTVKNIPVDAIEKNITHALNAGVEQRERDCRQSFWHFPAACFEPTEKGAQTLAGYTDYTRGELHPCGLGIFENSLGGRVCVSGYFPYTLIEGYAKTVQLKNILLWLSKNRLPAYVPSFNKFAVWGRKTRSGAPGAIIANMSQDSAENACVALLCDDDDRAEFTDYSANKTLLCADKRENGYNFYTIPRVGALEVCFLAVK